VTKEIKEIVRGCIAGKAKYQRMLYELFQRKMFGVCLRYAKDTTEAEDIAQEGFIKVFQNISAFKGRGSLEGWVKRIMINTALERFRKQEKLYLVEDICNYEDDYNYEDVISGISANELIKMIQELSPKYRMVFSLYAVEGYNHEEIGRMLNISPGTSKSNLSRARLILKEKIIKNYPVTGKLRISHVK